MKIEKQVIIIGGGPAGISAAIWCKRLGIDHLLIEDRAVLGGQLLDIQNRIIDYPGLMAINGQQIQQMFISHLTQLSCEYIVSTNVRSISASSKKIIADIGNRKQEISFQYLIMATGAVARSLGIPGEAEMVLRGEVYSATRDSFKFSGKRVIVVGGGDRATEGALMLANEGAQVTLVNRSMNFRARDEYFKLVHQHPGITVLTNAHINQIYGKEKVTAVKIGFSKGFTKLLQADAVFVRIGTKPNSQLLHGQIVTDDRDYIVVNKYGQTNNSNIFAIGDVCTEPLYSSIASTVGQGMSAVKQISLYLSGTNAWNSFKKIKVDNRR